MNGIQDMGFLTVGNYITYCLKLEEFLLVNYDFYKSICSKILSRTKYFHERLYLFNNLQTSHPNLNIQTYLSYHCFWLFVKIIFLVIKIKEMLGSSCILGRSKNGGINLNFPHNSSSRVCLTE